MELVAVSILRYAGATLLAAAIFAAGATGLMNFHENNRLKNAEPAATPSDEEFRVAFDRAVDWSIANSDMLLKDRNEWLWWFLAEAARLTENPELLNLTDQYVESLTDNREPRILEQMLFLSGVKPDPDKTYSDYPLWSLNHYGHAALYSQLCNKDFRDSELIKPQFEVSYCDVESAKDISSACITHQLLALYVIQRSACTYEAELEDLLAVLRPVTRTHLMLDPKVGDVYIQRILLLVLTGAGDMISPTWLRRFLDAQQDDGGWTPYQDVLKLTPDIHIGLGRYAPRPKTHGSTFHTTAQGLYLSALLMTAGSGDKAAKARLSELIL